MAVGDIITATRYNALQSRVESILAVGANTEGYGETTASSQVAVNDLVTASQVNQLKTDIDLINRHQTNQAAGTITSIPIGNLIADETSDNPDGIEKGFADYENSMTTLESSPNRFRLAPLQSSSGTGPSLTFGPTQWRDQLNGYVRATFSNSNHRRHFFNSGGSINFASSLASTATGGNVAKTSDWSTMLSNAGTVTFDHDSTVTSGSGTGSAIGNFQLTSSEQQIFRKSGTGVYADNNYYIRAREINTSVIEFRIWMSDTDSGTAPNGPNNAKGFVAIDEYIVGNLTTAIGFTRASGVYVDVTAPTITIQSNFSGS